MPNANNLATEHSCGMCGKPVDPKVDIYMSIGGYPLFPVHAGICRERVAAGAVATRDFIETRYPAVRIARTIFTEVMKSLNGSGKGSPNGETTNDYSRPNVQPNGRRTNARRPWANSTRQGK